MQLLLGPTFSSTGVCAGRLAGFELEPAERRIRRIVFSAGGNLGQQAMTRPLAAVTNFRGSTIELSDQTNSTVAGGCRRRSAKPGNAGDSARPRAGSADRYRSRSHEPGAAVGFGTASLVVRSITSTRSIDCSVPGELRSTKSDDTRAA